MLDSAINNQNDCTILFYGQTGTGKTFTMTTIQKLFAETVFSKDIRVKVGFFEIHFNKC